MPWIIQRYILKDLVRTFLLAGLALSVILTLGGLIRPIQRYGIGPGQVLDLIIYLWPVTATVVLPIAALFSATLTYGRLATDNEYDACKAAGISPLFVTMPGLGLAGVVAISNLILTMNVMPSFVQLADRAINADLRPIVFRQLQRQGYYRLGKEAPYAIYADYADPSTGRVLGVIVTETNDGRLTRLMGADLAQMVFVSDVDSPSVQIFTQNAFQLDLVGNRWLAAEGISAVIPVDPLFADKLRFKKLAQIKRIQADPIVYKPIAAQAGNLWTQALVELLGARIQSSLQAGRPIELQGQGVKVTIKAKDTAVEAGKIGFTGPVELIMSDPNGSRSWYARGLELVLLRDPLCIALDLSDVRPADGIGPVSRPHIPLLAVPGDIVELMGSQPRLDLLDQHRLQRIIADPSEHLIRLAGRLMQSIRSLRLEIMAELHSRLAFGIGCIPMVIIGIALAIMRRGGHLLAAFAISCVPAMTLVVLILSGKELARSLGYWSHLGIGLIWSGVAVLAILAAWLYGKQQR